MKYFVANQWWTELGREIAMNDLRNSMRNCIAELNKLHSTNTLNDAVEIAHKHGMKLSIKLKPKETTK